MLRDGDRQQEIIMLIKELIAHLQTLPPDDRICVVTPFIVDVRYENINVISNDYIDHEGYGMGSDINELDEEEKLQIADRVWVIN